MNNGLGWLYPNLNNYRLDAGRFVVFEILKYGFVRNVTTGGAEVAAAPEMATPIAFAKFGELHLGTMRRAALDAAHEVADRDMRRYLDEHMDMIFGQNTGDDLHPEFPADLLDNCPDAFA